MHKEVTNDTHHYHTHLLEGVDLGGEPELVLPQTRHLRPGTLVLPVQLKKKRQLPSASKATSLREQLVPRRYTALLYLILMRS